MRYRILYIDPSKVPEIDVFSDAERMLDRTNFSDMGTVEAETPKAAWRKLHTVPGVGMVSVLGADVRDVQFGDVLVDEQGNAVQFVIAGEAPATFSFHGLRGGQEKMNEGRSGCSAVV
jgi:hypothetical protein